MEGDDAEPVRDGSFEAVVGVDPGEGVAVAGTLGYPTAKQYVEVRLYFRFSRVELTLCV